MAYKDKSKKTAYQNEFIKSAYDRINLTVPKGRKAELQAVAERHGQSVNGFINNLIDEALEREGAGVMVSAGGSSDTDICSRSMSLTRPDSTTGLESEPAPKGTSVFDFIKQISGMSREEVDKMLGCDPESIERYRQEMERKRQRLAELNAKAGGLSRAEDAERRRLMADCKSYPESDDSAQE